MRLQVSHVASMFQLFFTEKPVYDYASVKTADAARYMRFHSALLRKGVFFPPSQFEMCFVSAAHSSVDLEKTVDHISSALERGVVNLELANTAHFTGWSSAF
ncbi:MAG: hypothetical protein QXJ76_08115 [Candidatus Bathyarchaeia archaeon]